MFSLETPSNSPLSDVELAWTVAYAEKPGRDYLAEHAELNRDQVIAIAYEIGAAALNAENIYRTSKAREEDLERQLFDYRAHPPSMPEPYVYTPESYSYTSIPRTWLTEYQRRPLSLEESPLIEEWGNYPT